MANSFLKQLLTITALLLVLGCAQEADPLKMILASETPEIQKVMRNLDDHEVQILYSQIDRDSTGAAVFKDYSFQLDANRYFYPASSVKWPAAVLALERLNEVKGVTMDTPYRIARDTLTHTVADDIRQLFAVSDNEAYNRLYELLGRDYLNKRLRSLSQAPIRYAHRLSTPNSNEAQRDTLFFENDVVLSGKKDQLIEKLSINGLFKGEAYVTFPNGEDVYVEEPMDFSQKNYFPLEAHHRLLKELIFPTKNSFSLTQDDRKCLLNAMSAIPHQQGYNRDVYYDSYGKFFLFGDTKDPIPNHIKIYNKVGYAYGTLTDVAYVKDLKNKVEFLLSATILVNDNEIFNDDTYEYDDIGIPFLAALGRQVYALELKRKVLLTN